jgi:hypothetical protein
MPVISFMMNVMDLKREKNYHRLEWPCFLRYLVRITISIIKM